MSRKLTKIDTSFSRSSRPIIFVVSYIIVFGLLIEQPRSVSESDRSMNSNGQVYLSVECFELKPQQQYRTPSVSTASLTRRSSNNPISNHRKCLIPVNSSKNIRHRAIDYEQSNKLPLDREANLIETRVGRKVAEVDDISSLNSQSNIITLNLSKSLQDHNRKLEESRSRPQIIVLPVNVQNEPDDDQHYQQEPTISTKSKYKVPDFGDTRNGGRQRDFDGFDYAYEPINGGSNIESANLDYYNDYTDANAVYTPKSTTNSSLVPKKLPANGTKKAKLWDQIKSSLSNRVNQIKLKKLPTNRSKRNTEFERQTIRNNPSDRYPELNNAIREGLGSLASIGGNVINAAIKRAATNAPIRLNNWAQFRRNIIETLILENPILRDPLLSLNASRPLGSLFSNSSVRFVDPQVLFRSTWGNLFEIIANRTLNNNIRDIDQRRASFLRFMAQSKDKRVRLGNSSDRKIEDAKLEELRDEISFIRAMNKLTLQGDSANATSTQPTRILERNPYRAKMIEKKRSKRSVGSLLLFGPWSKFYTALLLHKIIRHQSGMLYQAIMGELVRRYIVPTVGSALFPTAANAIKQVLPGIQLPSSGLAALGSTFQSNPTIGFDSQTAASQTSENLRAASEAPKPTKDRDNRLIEADEIREFQRVKIPPNAPSNASNNYFEDCQLDGQSSISAVKPRTDFDSMQLPQRDINQFGILRNVAPPLAPNQKDLIQMMGMPSPLVSTSEYLKWVYRLAHSGYSNLTKDLFAAGHFGAPGRVQTSISLMDPASLMQFLHPKDQLADDRFPPPMEGSHNIPHYPFPFPIHPDKMSANTLPLHPAFQLPPGLEPSFNEVLNNKTASQKMIDNLLKGASMNQLIELLGQVKQEQKQHKANSNDEPTSILRQLEALQLANRIPSMTDPQNSDKNSLSANVLADKILANTLELGLNNLLLPSGGDKSKGVNLVKNTSDVLVSSFGSLLKGLKFEDQNESKIGPDKGDSANSDNSEAPTKDKAISLMDKLYAKLDKFEKAVSKVGNQDDLSDYPSFVRESSQSGMDGLIFKHQLSHNFMPLDSEQHQNHDHTSIRRPDVADQILELNTADEGNEQPSLDLSGIDDRVPELTDDNPTTRVKFNTKFVRNNNYRSAEKNKQKVRDNTSVEDSRENKKAPTITHKSTRAKSADTNKKLSSKQSIAKKDKPINQIPDPKATRAEPKNQKTPKSEKPSKDNKPQGSRAPKGKMDAEPKAQQASSELKTKPDKLVSKVRPLYEIPIVASTKTHQHDTDLHRPAGSHLPDSKDLKIPLMNPSSRYSKDGNGFDLSFSANKMKSMSTRKTSVYAPYPESNAESELQHKRLLGIASEVAMPSISSNGLADKSNKAATSNKEHNNNLNNLAMALNVMNMVLLNQKLASTSHQSHHKVDSTIPENSSSKFSFAANNRSKSFQPSEINDSSVHNSSERFSRPKLADSKSNVNADTKPPEPETEAKPKLEGPTDGQQHQLPYRILLASSDSSSSRDSRPSDVSVTRAGNENNDMQSKNKAHPTESPELEAKNHRTPANQIRVSPDVLVDRNSSSSKNSSRSYNFQPLEPEPRANLSSQFELSSASDGSEHKQADTRANRTESAEPEYANRWNDVLQHLSLGTAS